MNNIKNKSLAINEMASHKTCYSNDSPYNYIIGMINMLANSPSSSEKIYIVENTIPVIDIIE